MAALRKDGMLAELDDETIIELFAYACETGDDAAADALEAEIGRRGIYGRKP
jgi:hypothetical protein